MNNEIILTIKDGGFIEIDERNGKALFRNIHAINSEPPDTSVYSYWVVSVYPLHDHTKVKFLFKTKSKADEFVDLLYEVCIDLDRMNSGAQNYQITKVRMFNYED